ncbi:phage tail protein [Uruburuella testudinis]|uniref:Phage tail protein n=1 Tax=Uruburuella testudinis TaxID=1282863 RepID=A0ABY4DXF5_9NEIS|nr:phage tail protein [Uruburuella testudinis]UOO82764.1 phage tail protein [Uruburuella testudinis]
MYAMLGDVRFETLQSFASLEAQHSAKFAKHEVLKGRPRLQALENDLTTLRFGLKLHWMLGNPDTAYKGLLTALEAQQAVSLVYGSGRFVGWFVIESLTERTLIQDSKGRTAARELDVELTEFVGDPNNPLPTPAIMSGKQNPLLSLLPESVQAQAADVMQAVEAGVKVYRAAESGIDEMQSLIQAARDIRNDPAALLNMAGDALNIGSGVLGRLNGLPEVTALLGNLDGAAQFTAQSAQAAQQLSSGVAVLRQGIESGSEGTWLDTAADGLTSALDSLHNGAAAAQTLTAFLATRRDL